MSRSTGSNVDKSEVSRNLLFRLLRLKKMDLLGSIMGKMDSGNLVNNRKHDLELWLWSRNEIYTKKGPPKGPAPTKKQKEIMEHNKKVIEHERKKKKYMKGKIEVCFEVAMARGCNWID